ncbi:MAG: TIGR03663 family protein [Chloroflexi bacterium]|nr:TIGR03663 family protein [Chloroflexota bacterium]MBT7079583.1 TIGR03663 family protein [Chloroflexota bacterium]MBT7467695.1 TIGR03663 family protein [Chloroflexota bacterium]
MPDVGSWVDGRWVSEGDPDSALKRLDASEPTQDQSKSGRGLTIPFRIEFSIYTTLVLIALAMRLYDLGGRAVHHDESLHGYFAYQLFNGSGYDHNPLMHGMFLFHSIATSFFFVSDSDFSLRLPMALFGTGLVLVPLLLKPRIGQFGALAAGVMLAFSPSILYYSRFARNDIFMAVFTLALVGVMWRYIDERKNRWLYIGAGLVAVGFATKETQYIVIALLGAFLITQVWKELRDWLYARRALSEFSPEASFLVLLATLSLPLLSAGVAIFQGVIGVVLAAEDGTPGVPTGSPNGAGWNIAIGISVAFLATSLAVGWYWNRRVFLGAFAVFAAVFILLFANFGSNPVGIGTGAWQSLGYWIAQHDVARGNQPWYYYFTVSSIYEFLPFAVATGAAMYYGFKSGIRPWIFFALIVGAMLVLSNDSLSFQKGIIQGAEQDVLSYVGQLALLTVYGSAIALTLVIRTNKFNKFLFFWTVGTFIAYTHAGEKMPWLIVNIALPAVILAASTVNDVVMSTDWRNAWRNGAGLAIIGVPLFFLMLWKIAFHDLGEGTGQFAAAWVILAVLGLLLLGLQVLSSRIGRSQALGIVGLLTVVIMFGFTFRAGWIASFENGDIPVEMLVYTQTSPDIHNLAKEIEQTANLTGDRYDIKLAIDIRDAYSWPWQWYLRRYSEVSFSDHTTEAVKVADDRLIAVINANNQATTKTKLPDGFSDGRKLVHRWWFPEEYRDVTPKTFFDTLLDRNRWEGSVDYFLYRKLSNPLGTIDSYVYFSDEVPLVPAK